MREIKLCVKILRLASGLRGALPDGAGQPIILKDRGRRFPAARWISPFSVAYSQVTRAHGCGL